MRNIYHPPPFDDDCWDQNPTASTAAAAAHKRQRRQAAAAFLFPTATATTAQNIGRKSTAQPRPVLHIPPRGIGPIVEPNANDVLCGR